MSHIERRVQVFIRSVISDIYQALKGDMTNRNYCALRIIDAWLVLDVLTHLNHKEFNKAWTTYSAMPDSVKYAIPGNIVEYMTENKG